MNSTARRVAVLGGIRIPFARQDGPYARASNQDMLTTALDALVEKFGLRGRDARRGRRRRRAQAQPRLQPHPGVRARAQSWRRRRPPTTCSRRAAPGSRRRSSSPTRSRSARSTRGSPAASTRPPTRRSRSTRTCATCCCELNRAKSQRGPAASRSTKLRPQQIVPEIPRNAEPRTGLSMGEHAAIMAQRVGHHPRGAGRARGREPPQPGRGLRHRLPRRPRRPVPRARARPEPAPGFERREAGEAEAGVRRPRRDDDRRQLDAAERRRLRGAAGQRGVGGRARDPGAGVHHRRPDGGRRPRPQARGAADGARVRDAEDARAATARRSRTSTSTRSTRRSRPRCCAR